VVLHRRTLTQRLRCLELSSTLIRCFRPRFGRAELERIKETLESGILASGPMVKEFENRFKTVSMKKFNIGFNSASSAAFAIFAYLERKYGQCQIYAPSLSFSSPIWAARTCGHRITFVDVSLESFSTSGELISRAIDKNPPNGRRTVILPLLYGGISSIDLGNLKDQAISVVDSCHTVNPRMDSDHIFFSFHPVKPISMGNGGMVSTDDADAADFFSKFRNFGRTPRGESYDVTQTGFNYYMNDLNAAVGLGQMEIFKENLQRRKAITEFYNSRINRDKYQLVSHVDSRGESSYYLYTLITKSMERVDELIAYLRRNGIEALIHYPLIHKLTYFRSEPQLENSEKVDRRFTNIPCHAAMTLKDAGKVVDALNAYHAAH
jgi:dTDP-4-amino-4,6-dideoxygalactose transaminase